MNQEDKGSVASKKDKNDSVNVGTKHHGVPRTESKATPELKAAPPITEFAELQTRRFEPNTVEFRNGFTVAMLTPWKHSSAYAELFTAAPALYEAADGALEYLNSLLGDCDADCECVMHPLRAALALARGDVPDSDQDKNSGEITERLFNVTRA